MRCFELKHCCTWSKAVVTAVQFGEEFKVPDGPVGVGTAPTKPIASINALILSTNV